MDVANDNSTAQEIFQIEHSTAPKPIIGVSSSSRQDNPQPASSTPADGASNDDLTGDEAIDLYINNLMTEKGDHFDTEAERQEAFDNLKNDLLRDMDRVLIASLPDEKLNQLNGMALRDGQIPAELIADMLTEENIDTTSLITEVMAQFRDIYLGRTGDSEEVAGTEITEETVNANSLDME